MNIALAHFRVGETDGVSLEMDKWKLILERLGHKVYMLAGSEGNCKAHVVPELHYQHPLNNKIVKNAYCELEDYNEEELKNEVLEYAARIQDGVEQFLIQNKIDVLVPNNIWSLGWGLAAGIGFYNAVKKTGVKCVAHNHDFHWEREKYSNPTCDFVEECLKTYFPPKDDLIKHVTINHIAKNELNARRGITATVVPNVFDFSEPVWKIDDYNSDFRESIGLSANDILILQATRITERKAIELAIDVIGKMINQGNLDILYSNTLYDGRKFSKDNRIVFVMAGLPESEDEYLNSLNKKAEGYGVEVLYINEIVEHSRCTVDGRKCYSLWDVYAHADLITYPSILEGWGNQLLEAVFAKKPVIVYEYPVFITDIKAKNMDFISLGGTHKVTDEGLVEVDSSIIENAAKEAVNILIDNKERTAAVEKNFAVCNEFFSYDSLEKLLKNLF